MWYQVNSFYQNTISHGKSSPHSDHVKLGIGKPTFMISKLMILIMKWNQSNIKWNLRRVPTMNHSRMNNKVI